MKRKLIAVILIALFALTVVMPAPAQATDQEQPITVLFNGQPLEFDTSPMIVYDRTYVPIRAIFEAMGANVEYKDYGNLGSSIFASKAGKQLILKMYSYDAQIGWVENGVGRIAKFKLTNTPLMGQNYRALIPLRSISELMGAKVVWYENARIVTIEGSYFEIAPPKDAEIWSV